MYERNSQDMFYRILIKIIERTFINTMTLNLSLICLSVVPFLSVFCYISSGNNEMAQSQSAIIMRILAASIQVANRAGTIIRDIMSKGELGIVEKVKPIEISKFS